MRTSCAAQAYASHTERIAHATHFQSIRQPACVARDAARRPPHASRCWWCLDDQVRKLQAKVARLESAPEERRLGQQQQAEPNWDNVQAPRFRGSKSSGAQHNATASVGTGSSNS
uniref:Uncharacterized protein n=1 Tax=Ralstonia solanacearum TaxID=305 RepID=A0A0S4UUY3_RALSL|nr:protein of unknown function [Ralstonia solanacearum]